VVIGCIVALAMYTMQHGLEDTISEISNFATSISLIINGTMEDISQKVQDISTPIEKVYFESIEDLITFLDADNVSDIEWTVAFVCADFTDALIERAEVAGYNTLRYRGMSGDELKKYSDAIATISYTVETPRGSRTWYYTGLALSGNGHAVCETTIENTTIIIEPQTDMIFELEDEIFIVLYKGEITKNR